MDRLNIKHFGISIPDTCPECGEPCKQVLDGIEAPKACKCQRKRIEEYEFQLALSKKREQKERIEKIFEFSKIGERFKQRTFETFDANRNTAAYVASLDYAENFAKYKRKGEGLLFIGGVGVGKTHLEAAIANYLIEKQQESVIFGTFVSLLGKIRQSYERNEGRLGAKEGHLLDAMASCSLLCVDDLGKEKKSQWVAEKMFEIFNARYEDLKPLVITTNFSLSELREYLDEAVFSRILEVCRVVECGGKDYRIEHAIRRSA